MTINEFIEKVGKIDNASIVKNTISVKEYLPFLEKKALAKRIVERCTVEENGFVIIDEIDKYLVFTVEVLSAYTNLEFDADFDVAATEYDTLVQKNKLGTVISLFDSEYKIVLELVRMEVDSVLQRNSVQYQTAAFFDVVNTAVNRLTGVLQNKIDSFNFSDLGVSSDQFDQIKAFIDKYNN